MLLGFLIIDLKFDYNPNKIYPAHYYSGHSSFLFPMLEGAILLAVVSSIIVSLVYRNKWNFMGLGLLVSALVLFAGFLDPLNRSIDI